MQPEFCDFRISQQHALAIRAQLLDVIHNPGLGFGRSGLPFIALADEALPPLFKVFL
jgi:hypothetical protein